MGKWITYTPAELRWIKRHCTLPRRDLHAAFCRRFGRTDLALFNLKALCTRRGWLTGRDGRFLPGQAPVNKGKPRPYNANSAKTQFKKGHRPANVHYIGHERLTKNGYVEVSIKRRNPYTGHQRRYVLKHKYLWEKKHGPVPAGMCLKCLDGNKQNTDPSNWVLVSRGLLPHINGRYSMGYDTAPAAVKPVVLALAKLKHAVNQRRKNRTSKKER